MEAKLLSGKRGVITGVINHRSIAWSIAKLFSDCGAEIILTYEKEDKWIRKLAEKINCVSIMKCDVTKEEEVRDLANSVGEKFGKIDFLVHAIAYAAKEDLVGGVLKTTRNGFLKTMEISTYSLIDLCNNLTGYFNENSSVISLSYLGASRVCVGYNLMGIAKAALESASRYLASEMGRNSVRVNVISAGPVRTLSGMGLPNFSEAVENRASLSPLNKSILQEDVANSALFLVSDLSTKVTGQILYVDSGYNVMGTWSEKN